MLATGEWELDQQNRILFVMVDSNGSEVVGLGTAWTIELSKNGAAFVAGAGTKAEISDGWYSYFSTAGEADTRGPLAVKITHASTVQQNLEYVVGGRNPTAVEFTYTVTSSIDSSPIDGVYVLFSTTSNFSDIVWAGYTDSLGVARDINGNKPWLDPGTYHIRLQKSNYVFTDDSEVVS